MDLKCSCCGSENLLVKRLSDAAQFGGIRLHLDERKFTFVDKARVCVSCGNIMPFVEPEVLLNLRR